MINIVKVCKFILAPGNIFENGALNVDLGALTVPAMVFSVSMGRSSMVRVNARLLDHFHI